MIKLPESDAVIFDMNGTIIDDDIFHEQAFVEFFRVHNLPYSVEDFRRDHRAARSNEIMEALFGHLSQEESNKLAEEKETIYRRLYAPHIHAIPGFLDFIEQLRAQETPIALATSSPQLNVSFTIDALGLQWKFNQVVTGREVVNPKPSPEIYFLTAERLGVDPSECLVFEDSPVGIAAAVAAGMRVIVRGKTDNISPLILGCISDYTEVEL